MFIEYYNIYCFNLNILNLNLFLHKLILIFFLVINYNVFFFNIKKGVMVLKFYSSIYLTGNSLIKILNNSLGSIIFNTTNLFKKLDYKVSIKNNIYIFFILIILVYTAVLYN